MRRKLLLYPAVVLLFVGLLISEPVGANPNFTPSITVPPPKDIAILFSFEAPQPNDDFLNGTMEVCFSVYLVDPNRLCRGLGITRYQGDWMHTEERCPNPSGLSYYQDKELVNGKHYMQYNFTIAGIPSGTHEVTFRASADGNYVDSNDTRNNFSLSQETTLTFSVPIKTAIFSIDHNATINVEPKPSITLLTPQKLTVISSSLDLNFTVDQPFTKMAYVLDNGESISISGNTTLSYLPNGDHTLTVFATNDFGQIGTSDTLFFSVQTITPIIACSISGIVVLFVTALVLVKRQRTNSPANK
jgi:hypothetical protein